MHSPRTVGRDDSINTTARRYQIAVVVNGNTVAGTNVLGLRKLEANAVARITRIQVTTNHAAAGLGVPLQVWRGATVAGGSQVTAADIPKKDTNDSDATLEVRTGAVTGTKANQKLLILGGTTVTGTSLGGPLDTWEAEDVDDAITLRGDEGIIFDIALAGDADDRYCITVTWEEE